MSLDSTNEKDNISFSGFNLDVEDLLRSIIRNWKIIVISVLLAFLASRLYLRYQDNIYYASAKLVLSGQKQGSGSGTGALTGDISGLERFSISRNSNVENEIEVLRSRKLIEKVIAVNSFNLNFFTEGNVKRIELYHKEVPITIQKVDVTDDCSFSFYLKSNNDSFFDFKQTKDENYTSIPFNKDFQVNGCKIRVSRKDNFTSLNIPEIQVVYSPAQSLVDSFQSRLTVEIKEGTSIVILGFVDVLKDRAVDFLNALTNQYNDDILEDQNRISQKTIDFITDRLNYFSDELTEIEKEIEQFKKKHKILTPTAEAQFLLNSRYSFFQKGLDIDSKLNALTNQYSRLKISNSNLIPYSITELFPSAVSSINKYNDLVLSKLNALEFSSIENPSIKDIDYKLSVLKELMDKDYSNTRQNLLSLKNDAENREEFFKQEFLRMPELERELKIIERQQRVKEALYLFLLQKKEETAISKAMNSSNTKIIQEAYCSGTPISPKTKNIQLIFLAVGLLVPVTTIIGIKLLDNKVKSFKDLKDLTIPYLGDIPLSRTSTTRTSNQIVSIHSNNEIAEAFRSVRTNIMFMLKSESIIKEHPKNTHNKSFCKKIFITSTISKEGKTFVSVNLGSVIQQTGKKVILVGADIRNPRLHDYFEVSKHQNGLTYFLSDVDADPKEIIKTSSHGFDYILSGEIPPNPSELISNGRFEELLSLLENDYDYIIVDTAPVGLVTDTFLIQKQADLFIYVIRANMLDRKMLHYPYSFFTEKKLQNMAILLNGVDTKAGYGYGYNYSYGYGDQVTGKGLFRKILKKFRR